LFALTRYLKIPSFDVVNLNASFVESLPITTYQTNRRIRYTVVVLSFVSTSTTDFFERPFT
jgi:hypothetical protein